jgi:hypothetical protein
LASTPSHFSSDRPWRARVLEQRFQLAQHRLAVELRRRIRILVRQRQVGAFAGAVGERHTDDLGTHHVKTGGLGIDRVQLGLFQTRDPGIQFGLGEYRLVIF